MKIEKSNKQLVTTFTDINLSGMSYEELVALKDQINLAIWKSGKWQEVEIPQGVWKVGEDIPAGKWTVKCAPYTSEYHKTSEAVISWGSHLDETGQKISWKNISGFGYAELYNPAHSEFREGSVTEYTFEAKDGDYSKIFEST